MRHLRSFKVFESVEEILFHSMDRPEWHKKRLSKGYDDLTSSEIKEIEKIMSEYSFDTMNYKSWRQLYCEYRIDLGQVGLDGFVPTRIKITISKCDDEWYYIEVVDYRTGGVSYYFEADSMEGLEDLLKKVISLYKNVVSILVLDKNSRGN